jgi:hypothetical protein
MCHSLRFLRLALLLGVAVEAENELGRAVFLRPTRTIPREELLKEKPSS